MEMTKNFYFSSTFDLTHTLQHLMANAVRGQEPPSPKDMYVWNAYLLQPLRGAVSSRWILNTIHGFFEQASMLSLLVRCWNVVLFCSCTYFLLIVLVLIYVPCMLLFLLYPSHSTHSECSINGRLLTLSLIARRSRLYAGTRYRKRGINDKGHVANDVETEQIVELEGRYTSYVQVRASIPLFWSQDSSPVIAKPKIVVQRYDPMHLATRRHFEDLFGRYGSPIMVVNLVRKREKSARETIIGPRFRNAVESINQYLPKEHQIAYLAWDFKKVSKSKYMSVVDKLSVIANWVLHRTGIFCSVPNIGATQVTPHIAMASFDPPEKLEEATSIDDPDTVHNVTDEYTVDLAVKQAGVMRVNCIDSLDRTNVAQYCVGKAALAHQLFALGLTLTPHQAAIGSSDIITVLLDMYERMGDCLALQYGGSEMHRQMRKDQSQIASAPALLKASKRTTKGKEMFVSLMRHYQNSFQDHEKQDAINLFLGLFEAHAPVSMQDQPLQVWDLESDFYLHNEHPASSSIVYALGRELFGDDSWWLAPIRRFLAQNQMYFPLYSCPSEPIYEGHMLTVPDSKILEPPVKPPPPMQQLQHSHIVQDQLTPGQLGKAPLLSLQDDLSRDCYFHAVYELDKLSSFDELLDESNVEYRHLVKINTNAALLSSKSRPKRSLKRYLGWGMLQSVGSRLQGGLNNNDSTRHSSGSNIKRGKMGNDLTVPSISLQIDDRLCDSPATASLEVVPEMEVAIPAFEPAIPSSLPSSLTSVQPWYESDAVGFDDSSAPSQRSNASSPRRPSSARPRGDSKRLPAELDDDSDDDFDPAVAGDRKQIRAWFDSDGYQANAPQPGSLKTSHSMPFPNATHSDSGSSQRNLAGASANRRYMENSPIVRNGRGGNRREPSLGSLFAPLNNSGQAYSTGQHERYESRQLHFKNSSRSRPSSSGGRPTLPPGGTRRTSRLEPQPNKTNPTHAHDVKQNAGRPRDQAALATPTGAEFTMPRAVQVIVHRLVYPLETIETVVYECSTESKNRASTRRATESTVASGIDPVLFPFVSPHATKVERTKLRRLRQKLPPHICIDVLHPLCFNSLLAVPRLTPPMQQVLQQYVSTGKSLSVLIVGRPRRPKAKAPAAPSNAQVKPQPPKFRPPDPKMRSPVFRPPTSLRSAPSTPAGTRGTVQRPRAPLPKLVLDDSSDGEDGTGGGTLQTAFDDQLGSSLTDDSRDDLRDWLSPTAASAVAAAAAAKAAVPPSGAPSGMQPAAAASVSSSTSVSSLSSLYGMSDSTSDLLALQSHKMFNPSRQFFGNEYVPYCAKPRFLLRDAGAAPCSTSSVKLEHCTATLQDHSMLSRQRSPVPYLDSDEDRSVAPVDNIHEWYSAMREQYLDPEWERKMQHEDLQRAQLRELGGTFDEYEEISLQHAVDRHRAALQSETKERIQDSSDPTSASNQSHLRTDATTSSRRSHAFANAPLSVSVDTRSKELYEIYVASSLLA
jgi:SacI homology domain